MTSVLLRNPPRSDLREAALTKAPPAGEGQLGAEARVIVPDTDLLPAPGDNQRLIGHLRQLLPGRAALAEPEALVLVEEQVAE
jgi:hypothetical protein